VKRPPDRKLAAIALALLVAAGILAAQPAAGFAVTGMTKTALEN
jgi:hypothetical protein